MRSALNIDQISERVEFYIAHPNATSSLIKSGPMTVENYIYRYRNESERAITYEQLALYLGSLLPAFKYNSPEYLFCKAIIDHPEYSEKIRVVSDGSYRLNRFWLDDIYPVHGDIFYYLRISVMNAKNPEEQLAMKKPTPNNLLKYCYKHYDEIYLHMPASFFRSLTVE